jgi:hypothetical protein
MKTFAYRSAYCLLYASRSAKRNRSHAIPRQLQIRGRIHAGKETEEENNGYVVIIHISTNR